MSPVIVKTVVFSIFFLVGSYANANTSYTVSPLVINLDLVPRDIVQKQITVTNTGTQPITLYPTVNNISLNEGGTIEEFLPPVMSDRTASLASWLEISRQGINVKIGETKTFTLTFRIHPEPKPGTYHAFVGFGYGRNQDEAIKMVNLGQANGTVVTVTLEDTKNEFLKLSKFIVDRFVTSVENQAAVFAFSNPGDEPVTPVGEIIIYDSTGKEVGALPVNSENLVIAPGEEHVFNAQVPIEDKFGKYKAFLNVEYGNAQRASVQDTSFFYIFPMKSMLTIFVLFLLVVAITAWYFHKKYFDDDIDLDDSDRLTMHYRESESEAMHHDINLKNP